jgi:radical SAM superfamily enzyme YgiQ (UPF0313 family)
VPTARNVVLVRLATSNNNLVTPPIGIGYLLKSLQPLPEVDPVFLDCKLDGLTARDLIARLVALEPLLVGFQVFSVDYGRLRRLLPRLKEAVPGATLVAGGPHVTGLPEHTLAENPALDLVVRGEGERSLPLLVQALLAGNLTPTLPSVPNLVYRSNGVTRRNPVLEVDVRAQGAPAWDLLRPDRYPATQHGTFHMSTRVVPLLTSRGCPYPCTFCAGHLITGNRVRCRDVGDVADEIEWLQRAHGFEEFVIEDENFTFHKPHVLAFAAEIERRRIRCHFSFPNGIRLDRLDEEIASRLRAMGTYMVCLGIESGSRDTLKRMRKNLDLQLVEERVRLLRRHGLIVNGSFILGFRDETMDDIRETVELALRLPIQSAYFGNYLPLPGTEDFETLRQTREIDLDRIRWDDYSSYCGTAPYHPRAVSEKQLLRAVRNASLRFYLRPHIALGIARRLRRPVFVRSFITRALGVFSPGRRAAEDD